MNGCNLTELFCSVLNAEYTHLTDDASFAFQIDGKQLSILFEKSNGRTDWKNNFNFPAKPYRNMEDRWYCHRGFLKLWKSIEPHLAKHILNPKIDRILVAGYSHGGAIAQLCYEYCRFHRPDCHISGFGFGAPRVVWGWMKKRVKYHFLGFVLIRNKRDLFTHLPPLIFGYRHAGTVLTIGTESRYGIIDAHHPENYIKELEKIDRVTEFQIR